MSMRLAVASVRGVGWCCICWLLVLTAIPRGLLWAQAATSTAPGSDRALVIAVSNDYPPFSFCDDDGRLQGMLVDLWRLWSQKTGRSIRFKSGSWAQTMAMLRNGEADIHSGLFRSAEREHWMAFSESYYEIATVYLSTMEHPPIRGFADLAKKKVGVGTATYQAEMMRRRYPKIECVGYEQYDQAVRQLLSGQTHGMLIESPEAEVLMRRPAYAGKLRRSSVALFANQLHAGVRADRSSLLDIVNAGLRRMIRRELQMIEARWIHDPEMRYFVSADGPVPLSYEQVRWLKHHRTIRVGLIHNRPPLQLGRNGQPAGLAVEYIRQLAGRLGLELSFHWYDTGEHAINGLTRREVDVCLCVSSLTRRRGQVLYSQPYLLLPTAVAVRRSDQNSIQSLSDLSGEKIAIVRGDGLRHWLEDYPISYLEQPDYLHCLMAVHRGEADACFGVLPVLERLVDEHQLSELSVLSPGGLPVWSVSMAVRDDWPMLVSVLDQALNSLDMAERRSLLRQWQDPDSSAGEGLWYQWLVPLAPGGIVVLVLMSVLCFWASRRAGDCHGAVVWAWQVRLSGSGQLLRVFGRAPQWLLKAVRQSRHVLFVDLLPVGSRPGWREAWQQAQQHGRAVTLIEGDSAFGRWQLHIVRTRRLGKQVWRVAGVEIGLRLARQQTLQSSAGHWQDQLSILQRYIVMAGHELRTPLQTMLGASELLARLPEEARGRLLSDLQQAGQYILTLLDQSRDDVQLLSGQFSVTPSSIDIHALVGQVARFAGWQVGGSVMLLVDLPLHEPAGYLCDPLRLRQILMNLLRNAICYTSQGHVLVRLTSRPSDSPTYRHVQLEVEDTGVGIADAQKHRIFEAYVQLNTSNDGMGLGLTISRMLVDQMGGQLTVADRIGGGSVFTVHLPLRVSERRHPVPAEVRRERRPVGLWMASAIAGQLLAGYMQQDGVVDLHRFGADDLSAVTDWLAENRQGLVLLTDKSGAGVLAERDTTWTDRNMSLGVVLCPADCHQRLPAGATPLYLPILPEDIASWLNPADVTGAVPIDPADVRHPIKVLLAEDDRTSGYIIAMMLRSLGCSVKVVRQGSDAVTEARAHAWDAVILDWSMPKLDGQQVAEQIRGHEAQTADRRVPILGLTGRSSAQMQSVWQDAGMDELLVKPIRLSWLRAALERLTGRRLTLNGSWPMAEMSRTEPDQNVALAIFDPTILLKTLLHNKQLAMQAVGFALEDIPANLSQIRSHLEADALDAAAGVAHTLKGSLTSMGAGRCGQAAEQMEQVLQTRRYKAIPDALSDLQSQVDVLVHALEQVRWDD